MTKSTKEKMVKTHGSKGITIKNVLGVITLAALMAVVVLLNFVKVENFWLKILATCYLVATLSFMVIIGTPKVGGNLGFRRISAISFVTWCMIIPIIGGTIISVIMMEFAPRFELDNLGFWLLTLSITAFSFVWFLTKLYSKTDYTNRLDLYSTFWIAVVTVLTTLFDLQEKKGVFVFLLAMYFILQILIKARICKNQEENKKTE